MAFVKDFISRTVHRYIPMYVLKGIFPHKYPFYNRYLKIKDNIGGKHLQLYFREDAYIEADILARGFYGNWEKESLKIWSHLAKRSSVIIDIGANTGIYALLAKNNNRRAKVIAVEPVRLNYEILRKNVSQNRFEIGLEQVAISDQNGVATMYILENKLNYMASVNNNRYAGSETQKEAGGVVEIEVPMKRYEYIHTKYDLKGLDLLKIDVEGHEVEVIMGMESYIRTYRPAILLEIIGDENALILDKFFTSIDYEFVSINETSRSVIVDRLRNNDHHNFLICSAETIQLLSKLKLVEEIELPCQADVTPY